MPGSSTFDKNAPSGADRQTKRRPDADQSSDASADPGSGVSKPLPKRSYLQKMAHELKTPLSAIVAASEIMRDEQLGPIGDDRYRRYAADIHDSAKLVLAIVDRMLTQRSRDAMQQPLEFTEFDPVALLHATVSTMLPLAERSQIRLALIEPSVKVPRIIADELSMKQILINLITNSLKFTTKGGKVSATVDYDCDGAFSYVVKDTGRGMSEQEIAAALRGEEPDGKTRDGGGLGVGLPLVQKLASANGARFELLSAPDQGTQARVIFPKDRTVHV